MKQYSSQYLHSLPPEPSQWIVDNLLRINRKRPSLLLGSPEAGKSSLARQLAIAISQGTPFLGRATLQGKVLYWQSEEDVADAREDFITSGMRQTDPIVVLHSEGDEDNCVELNKALCQHPDTRLVIIETLDDFLKTEDLLSNNENRAEFARLDSQVISKHKSHCCFLILHWLKKSDTQHSQHGLNIHKILGGTCIAGKTDAKIYMKQASDADQRRIIQVSTRKGLSIEPTYLTYDPATNRSDLGATVASEKAQSKIDAKVFGELETNTRLNALLHEHPGQPKWEIVKMMGKAPGDVGKLIEQGIAAGTITTGKGGKRGNAKLLYLTGHEPVTEESRKETVCQ